ncbi:MAG: amino acid ABC transporter ATP-binding protein [Clostridia bacterium]|nr:amino acid ABC transporter ATP-binding protein [Clostridia bacterium]
MLELQHVRKAFGDVQVLRDISLSVNRGDVVTLLGASGSGKTTLLRCAGFLNRADAGTVVLDGESYDLQSASRNDVLRYRRQIGFVFQNFNLFGNKTALQNVTAGLIIPRKMDRSQAEKIGLQALEKVGMLDRKDYYPSKLSGGQQQRVAIARAIALNPKVIFFDEPTSALDPQLTGEVLNVMKQLADEGTTMIVVTHEMAFARQVATKVVLMQDGVVIEESDPKTFFENPADPRTAAFIRHAQWSAEEESQEARI